MGKCLKCNVKMVYDLGKLKCAVCPECGYTENYIEDTAKIKKLILDIKKNSNSNYNLSD